LMSAVSDWSASTTRITVDPYWDDYSDLQGRAVNFDNIERFDLTGGSGNDYLAGECLCRYLSRGAGDDELDAFGGNDALTGGLGADMFDIRTGSGRDVMPISKRARASAMRLTLLTILSHDEFCRDPTAHDSKRRRYGVDAIGHRLRPVCWRQRRAFAADDFCGDKHHRIGMA